jgi:hypothetical protein
MASKRRASFHQSQSGKTDDVSSANWRELYLAALFETDKLRLPSRIAEAERAGILRVRELFVTSDNNCEEGKAVDKGLYALRALRNCLKLKTGEPGVAWRLGPFYRE